jgi:hypothetical protein
MGFFGSFSRSPDAISTASKKRDSRCEFWPREPRCKTLFSPLGADLLKKAPSAGTAAGLISTSTGPVDFFMMRRAFGAALGLT